MIRNYTDIKVFTGNAHPELAMQIARELGTNLGKSEIISFSDSETSLKIDENLKFTKRQNQVAFGWEFAEIANNLEYSALQIICC